MLACKTVSPGNCNLCSEWEEQKRMGERTLQAAPWDPAAAKSLATAPNAATAPSLRMSQIMCSRQKSLKWGTRVFNFRGRVDTAL